MLGAPVAQALTAIPYTPPPTQTAAPVTITAYAFDGTDVIYVQLFNKTDEVVDLSGWQLEYRLTEETTYVPLVQLDGMMKPSSYVLAAKNDVLGNADFPYELPVHDAGFVAGDVVLRLLPTAQYKFEEMKLLDAGALSYWQRNISDSTGNYLSTFSQITPGENYTLFTGGLYEAPETTALQINEILANPRDCSPIDLSMDCRDYVKLYNPTSQAIDLSLFRLRSGYQDQAATSSNTFLLNGLLEPGHYVPVATTEDGSPISLTNSGGYVWLEDVFGVKLYNTTVQNYPDAGSSTRKGQSWAYNQTSGEWQWSAQPTPADAPNAFPVISVSAADDADDDRVPCNANQYRSPETGRCRLLTTTISASLAPCLPGQYRNEATNRCRTLAVSTGLTPCDPGEERNPATNRCRKVTAAESTLVPCREGQERNPETNRCRNKVAAAASGDVPFPVEHTEQGDESFAGWWVLGAVLVCGAGYGVWEWRYELTAAVRRVYPRSR